MIDPPATAYERGVVMDFLIELRAGFARKRPDAAIDLAILFWRRAQTEAFNRLDDTAEWPSTENPAFIRE